MGGAGVAGARPPPVAPGWGFLPAWKSHLSRIPAAVRSIADSGSPVEKQNADLVKLGTPAIPFVLDEIESGHDDLALAAETLLDGTVEMAGVSPRGLVSAEWAKQNRERFSALRIMVDAAG
jgi:hypothetical protein